MNVTQTPAGVFVVETAPPPPPPAALTCARCHKSVGDSPPAFGGLVRGSAGQTMGYLVRPCCPHGSYVACAACYGAPPFGCPVCGCPEEHC